MNPSKPKSNQTKELRITLIFKGDGIISKVTGCRRKKILTQKALEKFEMDLDEWEQYELYAPRLGGKVVSSDDLEPGDEITVFPRISGDSLTPVGP